MNGTDTVSLFNKRKGCWILCDQVNKKSHQCTDSTKHSSKKQRSDLSVYVLYVMCGKVLTSGMSDTLSWCWQRGDEQSIGFCKFLLMLQL